MSQPASVLAWAQRLITVIKPQINMSNIQVKLEQFAWGKNLWYSMNQKHGSKQHTAKHKYVNFLAEGHKYVYFQR